MSAPEFNPTAYTPDGVAVFGSDNQLLVKFFKHPQISKYKSTEAGRPIFEDVIMIEVLQPGEKDAVRVLADEFHQHRFARQWENFQKGNEQAIVGTPLNLLFPNEPSTILTLNSFNIFTVDQLASISDTAMTQLPMGRALSDRAKRYLETANGGATFHQMKQEIDALTAKLQALTEAGAVPPATVGDPEKRVGKAGKKAEAGAAA